MSIVVGVDGSEPSSRAVEWCVSYAKRTDTEVVAVYALDVPIFAEAGFGFAPIPMPLPPPTNAERAQLRETVQHDWCAALERAGVTYRVVVVDGAPATSIMEVAAKEDAELVVAGRRGRGGFAELLLGSTTHQLSHHLDRPLVIVP